jgi:glyoxylase-like metal-dependent hydrolase (beta-lactamase superfamily II)
MKLFSIAGNAQRLDGGAMFGNCPRALWERWAPADDHHRIDLACRALLVDDGQRKVLFETGIGLFFEPKLRERFGVLQDRHVLLDSLAEVGVDHSDIDVVVLSHLHFDHAGGVLTSWSADKPLELLFPKATFVVGEQAWKRAKEPHFRDRASFIPELLPLLEASGRLELVSGSTCSTLPADTYSFQFSQGHTPGLMLARVATPRGPVRFAGDLIPGTPWVHLPITMGYDRYPELLIEEKRPFLDQTIAEQGWVFYTHDPRVACSRIEKDAKGKYQATEPQADVRWEA